MLSLSSKDMPNSFEYFNNLSYDKRVFFDRKKVVDTMIYEKALADTERDLAIDSLATGLGEGDLYIGDESKFGGSKKSRELITDLLVESVGPKQQYLLKVYDKETHKLKYSLNKDQVLKPLINKGYATEFLTEFVSFREHNKASSDMEKKLREKFNNTHIENISEVSYIWNKALTGRLYTNNENIQNIPKIYLSAMRGPSDDYLLVWGDFDQIDLRVAYYTILSESSDDDKLFEEVDDKYEAVARIIDRKLNREFNLERFKENRNKYKKGILARCYGQSLSQLTSTIGDKDFCNMLDSYFKQNKRYSCWYDSIIELIRSDVDYVDIYTYFGSKCHVTLTDCSTSEQKLDRILNCPIQGTSNDIIMHMTNETIKGFRSAGVSEDYFRVYMIRHDEPIFLIHKDYLHLLPIVRNNTFIRIDDWGPVTMTLGIGKYYNVDEYSDYENFFGSDEIKSNIKGSPRLEVYDPFINPKDKVEVVADSIRLEGDNLTGLKLYVNELEYDIDMKYNLRFSINNILTDYVIKNCKENTHTFDITNFPIKMYNIFSNGVYLNFVGKVGD